MKALSKKKEARRARKKVGGRNVGGRISRYQNDSKFTKYKKVWHKKQGKVTFEIYSKICKDML